MTEKWGEIQGKWGFFQVSKEFELSEFELSWPYCIYYNMVLSPAWCLNIQKQPLLISCT